MRRRSRWQSLARSVAFATLVAGAVLGTSLSVDAAVVSSNDCAASTVTVPVVADAWLDENSPSSNKGSDSVLSVDGGSLNVDTGDVSGRARALFRFAMPSAVPPGCVVESATLNVFSSEESAGARAEAVRLAGAWSEGGASWQNQPGTVGDAVRIWSREGYMQWKVTDLVQAMLDAGVNHGFQIRDAFEGVETAGSHGFYSREKGDANTQPELVIRFGPPGSGEPPGPVLPPSPASVSCGEVLTQSTLVTNDLSGCLGDGLVIGAPRIIVDLGGHMIDGTGLGAGIRNDGHASVTVRNGTVQDFDHGVQLFPETTLNVIEDLTLSLNQVAAVELFDVTSSQVRGNSLNGNGGGILLISGTRDSLVEGNTIRTNGGAGVLLQDATGNRVEDNSVADGSDLGIGLERASGNSLIGNTSSRNSDGGIELHVGSHDNLVEGNTVTESGDHGILVSESDGNELIGNVAHDMSDSGITLNDANDGVVRGNDVRFNTGGLQLDGSSRNLIESNDASETSGIGIELGGDSLGNVLEGNTADANGAQGIYVSDDVLDAFGVPIPGAGNLILGNTASGNKADGIVAAKGGHTITANVTRNNLGWGINAAPDSIDGSLNVAIGNGKPEQCMGVMCREDWLPPETEIAAGPAHFTASRSAQFVFAGSDDTIPAIGLSFACSLDGGGYASCASPRLYTLLNDGPHSFAVRATDASGNTDASPAVYHWTIDGTPPDTSITEAPTDPGNTAGAQFSFSGTDNASAGSALMFDCRVDGAAWTACTSPADVIGLAEGKRNFEVRAVDEAGNVDPSPAGHVWLVDTIAPGTAIDAGPAGPTNDPTPTFAFSSEPGAALACRVDDAAFADCSSPHTTAELADGAHTFAVRATDAAGNSSQAGRSFTVDTVVPDTVIDAAPLLTTNQASATFEVSAESGATFGCSLDGADFAPCGASTSYAGLSDGAHTFAVRATDAAGNSDPSPAGHAWTVDTVAPETAIDAGPPATTLSTSARFEFSADELESAFECSFDEAVFAPCTSGREYAALADGSHTFQVRAIDRAGNVDATPATQTWLVDTIAPGTAIDAGPAGPTNDPTPTFAFSSEPGAALACRVDDAAFADCSSPHTTAELADGAHTFAVRATDAAGNSSQAGRSFTVDTVVPDTVIDAAPLLTTNQASATFEVSAESGATFGCSLDGADFAPCGASTSYAGLSDGAHTFAVRATDAAGNSDPSPAGHAWTVDTVAPETAIDAGPPATTLSTSARFEFSADELESAFECSFDEAVFAPCTSGREYAALADGSHTFQVRAIDRAGNVDATPATQTWLVDTIAPGTAIDAGPAGPTNDPTPTFAFSSEPGAALACRVDDAAFADCSSPHTTAELADGAHTFAVRATDAAGNSSQAGRSFTVDTVVPDTVIDAAPLLTTNQASATFEVSAESGATFGCSLDGADFAPCGASTSYAGLSDGAHTFAVRATDAAGNSDPSPAGHAWTVDTVAPETAIDAGPPATTLSTSATLTFSSSEAGSTFECALDNGAFAACASPREYTGLAVGSHQFRVLAIDAAGNRDESPEGSSWTIEPPSDVTPPETTISGQPANPSNSPSASFTFGGSDNETPQSMLAFQCRLDSQVESAFVFCSSPRLVSSLSQGTHTFQVRAVDLAGNRDLTPAGYTWTVDTTPPDTTITAAPPSSTPTTSASFGFGSSESGSTFQCSLDGAAFAACTSPHAYSGLAVGPHQFRVRAIDPAGNVDATPAAHGWTIQAPPDTTPPDTTITAAPPSSTPTTSASFGFGSSESGSTFQCSLDGAAFAACTSPHAYSGLAVGPHQFRVRAIDPAGNVDATPAAHGWTIQAPPDTTPPDTTITAAPPSSTPTTSASFGFGSSESGSTFQCSLDGAAFAACTSPHAYSGLAVGPHQFRVRAIDPAGNVDATPAAHGWTIQAPPDTTPPDTTITAAPPSSTPTTSASFGFGSSESGSTFQCSLDGAAFAACTSPHAYSGLAVGPHQFRVRAIDPAGNVDATPAAHGWTIQAPGGCTASTVTVPANADSWLLQSSATSNYGNDSVLKVDTKAGADARLVIRFVLPALPKGCSVVDAKLHLYGSSYKTGRTLSAVRLGGSWTEGAITWSNQPSATGSAATAPSAGGIVTWTVPAQVQAMYDNENNGFLVRDSVEGGNGVEQGFHSREKGTDNPPRLVVTFG